MRVLLVEDDRDMVELLGLLLREMAGWEVLSYTDARRALEDAAVLQTVDLALVDLRMEPLAGPDLVRQWRARRAIPCPVVYLTGQRPSNEELELVDGAIQKPFTYQELMGQLRAILGPRMGP
jgi:DNA-binding response OmpR family regulator